MKFLAALIASSMLATQGAFLRAADKVLVERAGKSWLRVQEHGGRRKLLANRQKLNDGASSLEGSSDIFQCDKQLKKHENKVKRHSNNIDALVESQTVIESEFNAVLDHLEECKANIGERFEWWGCNPPDEGDEQSMQDDLDGIQKACLLSSSVHESVWWPQSAEEDTKCAADYGAQVGDPVCCGQAGTVNAKTISTFSCSQESPLCTGYVKGNAWGSCVRYTDSLGLSELKEWALALETASETNAVDLAQEKAGLEAGKEKLEYWQDQCSFESIIESIVDLTIFTDVLTVSVADLVTALKAVWAAIGCLLIKTALSVIGAVLDQVVFRKLALGIASTFPAMWGVLCTDPFERFEMTGDWESEFMTDSFKEMCTGTFKNAVVTNGVGWFFGAFSDGWMDTAIEIGIDSASSDGAGLVQSSSSSVARRGEASFIAHHSKQDIFQLLWAMVSAVVIAFVERSDMSDGKKEEIADIIGGENASIVQWVILRMWDAVCGALGTVIMEIASQLVVCNLCEVCSLSECVFSGFLIFRDDCKAMRDDGTWSLVEEDAASALTKQRDSAAAMCTAPTNYPIAECLAETTSACEGCVFSRSDTESQTEVIQGKDGDYADWSCDDWCSQIATSSHPCAEVVGAASVESHSFEIGGETHSGVEFFAEATLLRDGAGNSPCCSATSACTACQCKLSFSYYTAEEAQEYKSCLVTTVTSVHSGASGAQSMDMDLTGVFGLEEGATFNFDTDIDEEAIQNMILASIANNNNNA